MLVAGEDGDGVNALFPSVLHGTVWKSLEKGCHEEKGPARHRDDCRIFSPIMQLSCTGG